jgi:hypothetical protein
MMSLMLFSWRLMAEMLRGSVPDDVSLQTLAATGGTTDGFRFSHSRFVSLAVNPAENPGGSGPAFVQISFSFLQLAAERFDLPFSTSSGAPGD